VSAIFTTPFVSMFFAATKLRQPPWWIRRDLNPQPTLCKSAALPIELLTRYCRATTNAAQHWCGKQASNPQHPGWWPGALPFELLPLLNTITTTRLTAGIEPATRYLQGSRTSRLSYASINNHQNHPNDCGCECRSHRRRLMKPACSPEHPRKLSIQKTTSRRRDSNPHCHTGTVACWPLHHGDIV
jgi:hypothetical protein